MRSPRLEVASFFSGIGGFDLGFERAGFKVVFQCERDKFCQKVLEKNWPKVKRSEDIRTLSEGELPQADVWCAGFPCQDLSLANQGKRKGLAGERSGLFDEFGKLAASFPPRWIVLENVPGLLNSHGGTDFKHVLDTLGELGYFVAWRVLDSQYFGTPQRRRRVFIVASYQADGAATVLLTNGALAEVAGPRVKKSPKPSAFTREGFQESDLFAIQHATIGRKPFWSGPQGKGYRNDGKTYTLDSRGSSDVVCAPYDGFGVRGTAGISGELDSRRLRACGNAVCVDVVEWIAKRIRSVDNLGVAEKPPANRKVRSKVLTGPSKGH
jgi:DNA (cytosine-5)-methyltransferase 1